METLYHWLGVLTFWGLVAALLVIGWRLRPRNAFTRYMEDVWQWVAVYGFGKRFLFPKEGARLLFTVDRGHKWPRWKRNLMAFNVRYSKQRGWREPH